MSYAGAGIDGLAITKSWIRDAFENLHNALPTAVQSTPNNILREAYLALLTWPATHELPEVIFRIQPADNLTVPSVYFLDTSRRRKTNSRAFRLSGADCNPCLPDIGCL